MATARRMWHAGVVVEAFADNVGLHTDRASGAVELVVQAAPIEREYECSFVWLAEKNVHVAHRLPLVIFPPKGVAVVWHCNTARTARRQHDTSRNWYPALRRA